MFDLEIFLLTSRTKVLMRLSRQPHYINLFVRVLFLVESKNQRTNGPVNTQLITRPNNKYKKQVLPNLTLL